MGMWVYYPDLSLIGEKAALCLTIAGLLLLSVIHALFLRRWAWLVGCGSAAGILLLITFWMAEHPPHAAARDFLTLFTVWGIGSHLYRSEGYFKT